MIMIIIILRIGTYTPYVIVSSDDLFVRLNNYYYYTHAPQSSLFSKQYIILLSQGVMTRTCGWCAALYSVCPRHAPAATRQYNDFSYYSVITIIIIYVILTQCIRPSSNVLFLCDQF